jgi:hypothetical protein
MMRIFLLAIAACSNAAPAKPDAPFLPIDAAKPDAAPDAGAIVETALGYTSGTYTDSFDGLPTVAMSSAMVSQTLTGKGPLPFSALSGPMAATAMDGWELANPTGTSMDTEFRVHDGSLAGSMGRGIVSFGTDGSTERALGALATGNQIGRFGLLLENNSAATLNQITIGFTGEQWRRGDVAAPDSLTFEYGLATSLDATGLTEDTDLKFIAPVTTGTSVAVDGNAAANHHTFTKTINAVSWAPGTTLVLRWTTSTQSGKDDGLAIDDFSFTAHN